MFQSNKSEGQISSILSPEVEIHGDVIASGSMLIYGKVLGSIKAGGTVRTAKGSLVKGNINAKNAMVNGTVEGDLIVEKKVTLGSKSKLLGNLNSQVLGIEEGAQFEGICNMAGRKEAKTSDTTKTPIE